MKTLIKFFPIIVLGGMLVNGYDILIAAPIAVVLAMIICKIIERHTLDQMMNDATESVKKVSMIFFVMMFSYALAEVFLSSGVGASVIITAINLGITGKTVALVAFLLSCVLAVATGTSWGTFAACAPVFLWLTYIVGGDVVLTACAVAGGSCFGDNIGLISDTTVLSSGFQNVTVVDRVRHQGVWSLCCVILSSIAFFIAAIVMELPNTTGSVEVAINSIPESAWEALASERPSSVVLLEQVKAGVPFYMVIPLIVVVVCAIFGLPTMICLGIGILIGGVFGFISGSFKSLQDVFSLVEGGFASAGSWALLMMVWVSALGGIMSSMNAFEPISKLAIKLATKVRHVLVFNGFLFILGNACLGDENSTIVTISPIVKEITDKNVDANEKDMYKLRLRNALFADAGGCFGSQLIPWHTFVLFYAAICNAVFPLVEFSPFDIIRLNFMAFFSVGTLFLLTATGWDRFIPLFKLPQEPDVKLNKSVNKIKN